MEGSPNELRAQKMEYCHHYDEIMKHFEEGRLEDLQLHDVKKTSYYTNKHDLWLDFRTIGDNRLNGLGR